MILNLRKNHSAYILALILSFISTAGLSAPVYIGMKIKHYSGITEEQLIAKCGRKYVISPNAIAGCGKTCPNHTNHVCGQNALCDACKRKDIRPTEDSLRTEGDALRTSSGCSFGLSGCYVFASTNDEDFAPVITDKGCEITCNHKGQTVGTADFSYNFQEFNDTSRRRDYYEHIPVCERCRYSPPDLHEKVNLDELDFPSKFPIRYGWNQNGDIIVHGCEKACAEHQKICGKNAVCHKCMEIAHGNWEQRAKYLPPLMDANSDFYFNSPTKEPVVLIPENGKCWYFCNHKGQKLHCTGWSECGPANAWCENCKNSNPQYSCKVYLHKDDPNAKGQNNNSKINQGGSTDNNTDNVSGTGINIPGKGPDNSTVSNNKDSFNWRPWIITAVVLGATAVTATIAYKLGFFARLKRKLKKDKAV